MGRRNIYWFEEGLEKKLNALETMGKIDVPRKMINRNPDDP